MQIVTYSADQVWGLAVRADTLNGGYIKDATWKEVNGSMVKDRESNKVMVKQWLREDQQPTEEEAAKGREYRAFFNSYTLKALRGGLSDFDRQALKIAQMEEFTGRNLLEIAIASCLPSSARREQARNDFKREFFASEALPVSVGDEIVGDITVTDCKFNHNYNKHRITARMGESFVDFWFSRNIDAGATVKIKGKVKNVRGDKTTQLHYVKFARG